MLQKHSNRAANRSSLVPHEEELCERYTLIYDEFDLDTTWEYMALRIFDEDGEESPLDVLVDVKAFWAKLLWLKFWRGLRIFLWSLLFIIPGIVAAYSYSQARYILFENPEKTPAQCIAESMAIMRGRKQELFTLDVSFALWWLLMIVTAGMAAFYAVPYYRIAHAGFYREVRNSLAYQPAPVGFADPNFQVEPTPEVTVESA